jgi:hypothetical protein
MQINSGPAGAFAAKGWLEAECVGHEHGVLGIRAYQERKHIVVGTR